MGLSGVKNVQIGKKMPEFNRYSVISYINTFGEACHNYTPNGLGMVMKANEVIDIVDKYEREIMALKMEIEELKDDLELKAEYD